MTTIKNSGVAPLLMKHIECGDLKIDGSKVVGIKSGGVINLDRCIKILSILPYEKERGLTYADVERETGLSASYCDMILLFLFRNNVITRGAVTSERSNYRYLVYWKSEDGDDVDESSAEVKKSQNKIELDHNQRFAALDKRIAAIEKQITEYEISVGLTKRERIVENLCDRAQRVIEEEGGLKDVILREMVDNVTKKREDEIWR